MNSSNKLPTPIGPYSLAVHVGNFTYCSGQIGISPETGELAGDSIEDQTSQILKNIEAILNQYNLTKEDIIKTTIFLKNIQDFNVFNTIYASYFMEHKPARSTVEVSNLPKGALIEIEIIAYS
jgi:2-iminobutanoate/2-iminopropanoate deaminase